MFFSPFLFWDPYFWLILVGLAITCLLYTSDAADDTR